MRRVAQLDIRANLMFEPTDTVEMELSERE